MDMRVDAAGDHDLAGGVEDPPAADRREAPRGADRGDLAADHNYIGRLGSARQNRGPARDDQVKHAAHLLLLALRYCARPIMASPCFAGYPPGPWRKTVSAIFFWL